MRKCLNLVILAILAILGIMAACTPNSGMDKNGGSYSINGTIQKGPFVLGSDITIQPLNDNLNPIGQLYNTFTTDNAGCFDLESQLYSKYAEIIANGYYFDEVVGELSSAPLTLRSITALDEDGVANVNLLTTLIFQRIRNLVNVSDLTITEATIQAERELFLTLGIPGNYIPDVRCGRMDISQSGDHNALLLTISVALQYNRSVGELSELIAKLGVDLADDGIIDSQYVRSLYINNTKDKIVNIVRTNLRQRYNNLGVYNDIPNLEKYIGYFLDVDSNGVADQNDFIILAKDAQMVKANGGRFSIPFSYVDMENVDVTIGENSDNIESWLSITKTLSNVDISVQPNVSTKTRVAEIIISEISSKRKVSFFVRQEAAFVIDFTCDLSLTENSFLFKGDVNAFDVVVNDGKGSFCFVKNPTKIESVIGDITSITLPNTINSITMGAFNDCSNLQAFYGELASSDNRCFVLNNELKYFLPAGLTEYTIPNDITSIGSSVFANCSNLTSITIPDSVTEIGTSAFKEYTGCLVFDSEKIMEKLDRYSTGYNQKNSDWLESSNISEIIIGPNVKTIGACAFEDIDTLLKVTISDNVTAIGDSAFAKCDNLACVVIGNGVTKISQCVFYCCSNLTDVTMPNSVTCIDVGAFANCSSLISINIPENVTYIGGVAFRNCTNLQNVYCKPITPPTMGPYVFQYIIDSTNNTHEDIGCAIYVPRESVDAYKTAEGWRDYAADIVPYDF